MTYDISIYAPTMSALVQDCHELWHTKPSWYAMLRALVSLLAASALRVEIYDVTNFSQAMHVACSERTPSHWTFGCSQVSFWCSSLFVFKILASLCCLLHLNLQNFRVFADVFWHWWGTSDTWRCMQSSALAHCPWQHAAVACSCRNFRSSEFDYSPIFSQVAPACCNLFVSRSLCCRFFQWLDMTLLFDATILD